MQDVFDDNLIGGIGGTSEDKQGPDIVDSSLVGLESYGMLSCEYICDVCPSRDGTRVSLTVVDIEL